MSNNKFPGFIEITAERAQAIQYDVQLWYSFDDDSEAYKAYSPEHRRNRERENPRYWEDYWDSAVTKGRKWYIKIDEDKPEYTPNDEELNRWPSL